MSTQGDTDPKTKTSPPKPQANTNKQKSGGAVLGFFVFLTFLLAIAGIGAGYYVWQQIQQQFEEAEVERKALEHALSTLDENPRIKKFSHSVSKKIEETNTKVKEIDTVLNSVSKQQEHLSETVKTTDDLLDRSQTGWMLREIEHVLRMSQHRLLLDRDFDGALAGLKAADQRLNEIDNFRLVPIRQSIAKQTRALNQFPHPDYTGIQLQLDSTIDQLKHGLLKQANDIQTTAKSSTKTNSKQEVDVNEQVKQPEPFNAREFWETSKKLANEASDKVKAALSDSVHVTRGEQKIALFIEEQEKKRAYDFLRNKLLGAKYSVSTRDDNSFHQQLNAALAWLDNNDQFTNGDALSKEIKELNKVNLMPALPDISEPSVILAKYMNTLKDKK